LWKTSFQTRYNAASPMVDGQTVIYSGPGPGTKAVKLEKQGDTLAAKELWSNSETATQYNTPVMKNGLVFGISDRGSLFCLNSEGKTAWTASLGGGDGAPRRPGGRMGGQGGYGSVVDAGPVLMALTPSSQLVVFEPNDKEFKKLASYKVADSPTYAYPVV